MIKHSNREDLKDIVKAQFPSLEPLSEKLIGKLSFLSYDHIISNQFSLQYI